MRRAVGHRRRGGPETRRFRPAIRDAGRAFGGTDRLHRLADGTPRMCEASLAEELRASGPLGTPRVWEASLGIAAERRVEDRLGHDDFPQGCCDGRRKS